VAGGLVGLLIIRPVNWVLGLVFRVFNVVFDLATRAYGRMVGWSLRLCVVVLLIYGGLLALTYYGFTKIPVGFIPAQDKGYLIVNVQLPDSASLERTLAVMDRIQKIVAKTPGVEHSIDIPGQSFVMNGVSSNFGSVFIILKPFHERRSPDLYSEAIAQSLRGKLYQEIEQAQLLIFGAPAVEGLGSAGGFKVMLEATGNPGSTDRQLHRERVEDTGVHRHV
jgi:multidrug efflux pump